MQTFLGSVLLAILVLPHATPAPSLNERLGAIVASVAAAPQIVQRAPITIAQVSAPTTQATCNQRVQPSRLLRYGAQLVNAFIVGNAIHRGAQARGPLGTASTAGYVLEYGALDFLVDRLDARASCKTQSTINSIFALGALYNAGQTEFPK